MNFYKRSYQPILHYLYTETIKRQGEISLHRHFKMSGVTDKKNADQGVQSQKCASCDKSVDILQQLVTS